MEGPEMAYKEDISLVLQMNMTPFRAAKNNTISYDANGPTQENSYSRISVSAIEKRTENGIFAVQHS